MRSSSTGTERSFATGDVLCRQDDESDEAYVVIDGAIAAQVVGHAGPMTVATHGPGSIVGEVTTLIGGHRTAALIAAENEHGGRGQPGRSPSRVRRSPGRSVEDPPGRARAYRSFACRCAPVRGAAGTRRCSRRRHRRPGDVDLDRRRRHPLRARRPRRRRIPGGQRTARRHRPRNVAFGATPESDRGRARRHRRRVRAPGGPGPWRDGGCVARHHAGAAVGRRFCRPHPRPHRTRDGVGPTHPRTVRQRDGGVDEEAIVRPRSHHERHRRRAIRDRRGNGRRTRQVRTDEPPHALRRSTGSLRQDGISDTPHGGFGEVRLAELLHQAETESDHLLLDTGPGLRHGEAHHWVDRVLHHADQVVVICSPDPDDAGDGGDPLGARCHPSGHPSMAGVAAIRPSAVRPSRGMAMRTGFGVDEVHHLRGTIAAGPRSTRPARRRARRRAGAERWRRRGHAHLGVYAVLSELGVPVDRVVGASMGSIVAGGIGQQLNPTKRLRRCRRALTTSSTTRFRSCRSSKESGSSRRSIASSMAGISTTCGSRSPASVPT